MSSLVELFDFRLDKMANPYPEVLLEVRERFRSTYVDLAQKNPQLKIRIMYCTRGDVSRIAPNVASKMAQLENSIGSYFSRATIEAKPIGATQLLHLAQQTKKYSLKLIFTETYISRDSTNYIVLARLRDYLQFITDENGNLRRYLFDGNVRDYLGDVQVNADIAKSLSESTGVDFWWLNNGVTILASNTTVVGRTLSIENVLIVNGLQTTETIFRTLAKKIEPFDERAVLIKIIISSDDEIRARIIKATNYQNTVDLSSLRSLDQIQRNIEAFLFDYGWFYERRSNFYRNQGKSADRILSIRQLGTAVRALAFRTPRTAERRQKWLRDDNSYRQVFNPAWPLGLHLACAAIVRSVELTTPRRSLFWKNTSVDAGLARQWGPFIALVVTCVKLKDVRYEPQRMAELAGMEIGDEEIRQAADHILASKQQRNVARGSSGITIADEKAILDDLVNSGYVPLKPDLSWPIEFLSKRTMKRDRYLRRAERTRTAEKDREGEG